MPAWLTSLSCSHFSENGRTLRGEACGLHLCTPTPSTVSNAEVPGGLEGSKHAHAIEQTHGGVLTGFPLMAHCLLLAPPGVAGTQVVSLMAELYCNVQCRTRCIQHWAGNCQCHNSCAVTAPRLCLDSGHTRTPLWAVLLGLGFAV
jgi:hypothetical protein